MIDIHCHVLPGIDDGPEEVEASLLMLKQAVNEGIETIVVTPHRNERYHVSVDDIRKSRDSLQDLANENNIPVALKLGQEIRIYGEMLKDYLKGELFSIDAMSRYILIEFDSAYVPKYASELFYDMRRSGLIPIIVHPERNSHIRRHPEILYRFIQNGALSQITASSVVGRFGKKIQKFSHELIKANLVHFIASDAHDLGYRNFFMKKAFNTLERKYGQDCIRRFENNAKYVLRDEEICLPLPLEVPLKKPLNFWRKAFNK